MIPLDRSASASQAEASGEGSSSSVEPAWTMRGDLDFGFRWASPGGNEDKYREDWNFQTGPRLFNMDVSVRPLSPSLADVFSLEAVNLGGDPFARFGLALRKFDRYSFRFERRSAKYFYRDTIVPHEEASVAASSGGDFHTFDFERVNDTYELDVDLGSNAGVFLRFNRQTRMGDSTTTLDVSRDEFELDRPLVEEKNDYLAGFKWSRGNLALSVDQSFRDYTSDGRLFLPGASVGENPEGSTELSSLEQLLPFDFTMPQTTVRFSHTPHPRVSVVGSAVFRGSTASWTTKSSPEEWPSMRRSWKRTFGARPRSSETHVWLRRTSTIEYPPRWRWSARYDSGASTRRVS